MNKWKVKRQTLREQEYRADKLEQCRTYMTEATEAGLESGENGWANSSSLPGANFLVEGRKEKS